MADPLSPDAIAQRTFGQRLRGYNPDEVRAFLEEVSVVVGELKSRSEALHTRLLELGNRDLTTEFNVITEDVGRILHEAREAAEGMRKRAAADAELLLEEANAAAVELRTDAWMASDKLLQDSGKEAGAMVQAAERDSLVITSEAEREAHHRQSAARRESEETVRAAKLEAERVLMDARARSDELILDANRKVTAAEERAAATEERRAEMLAELENAQTTISNLEGEIEKRREALAGPSPEEVESSTVKLLTGPTRENDDDAEGAVWAEGHEVVKIVRPPKRIVEPPSEPVDADAMAAEVARLRSPGKVEDLPVAPGEREPELPAPPNGDEDSGPAASGLATEQPVEPDQEPPIQDGPSAPATDVVEDAPVAAAIDAPPNPIDDLFARLRRVEEETPAAITTPAEPAGREGDESEPDIPARPGSPPDRADNLFDTRDRLLLPVTNRVLRAVKRELTEAQNIALEELRVEDGNWEPDAVTLVERLAEPIGELLSDSYGAGWAAAAGLTERELVFAGEPQGDPAEVTTGFAAALTVAVSEALAESRRDGRGPRQAAAGLSRVYRSWRTDEAERRVRDIAAGAYHRGLIEGFAAAGLDASRWVVAGRGCTVCREAAETGPVALGAAFEDSVTEPPAHPDCGCTLAPA